ncbi:uncharacterized protein KGF55_002424 [Candida pseudojiufengensis]|uniref:uncharacterized protein n=1 Tax=Candida pseudojiufengensis TaxID=497109 RepID=UPI002224FA5F|nr:uncharacterized protein KGF55_002424 [Candida pseudojiufengensis]KAI5963544.1 hypothetical protein KGF55_002424 [Candida pseudojiufengensis]
MSSSLSRSKLFKSNKNLKKSKNLVISGPIDEKELYNLQNYKYNQKNQNQNNNNHIKDRTNSKFHQSSPKKKTYKYNCSYENHIILISKYIFESKNQNELSITAKKFYKLIKKIGNGWLLVCDIENNQNKGLVPASYMEIGINDILNPITLDWLHHYEIDTLPIEDENLINKNFENPIDCLIDEIYQDLNNKKIWYCLKFQYDSKLIYINRNYEQLNQFYERLDNVGLQQFPKNVEEFKKFNSQVINQLRTLCFELNSFFKSNLNNPSFQLQLNQLIFEDGKFIEIYNDDDEILTTTNIISKFSTNSILIDKLTIQNSNLNLNSSSNYQYFKTEPLPKLDRSFSSSITTNSSPIQISPIIQQQRSFSTSAVPITPKSNLNKFNYSNTSPNSIIFKSSNSSNSPSSVNSPVSPNSPNSIKSSRKNSQTQTLKSRSRSSSSLNSRVYKIPDQLNFETKEEEEELLQQLNENEYETHNNSTPNVICEQQLQIKDSQSLLEQKHQETESSHLKLPESISCNTLMSYGSLIDGYEDTSINEQEINEQDETFSVNERENNETKEKDETNNDKTDLIKENEINEINNKIDNLNFEPKPLINSYETKSSNINNSDNRNSKRTDSTSSSTLSSNNLSIDTNNSSIDCCFNQNQKNEKVLSPLKCQIIHDFETKEECNEATDIKKSENSSRQSKTKTKDFEQLINIPKTPVLNNNLNDLLLENNGLTTTSTPPTTSSTINQHNSLQNSINTISTSITTSPITVKTQNSSINKFFTNITPPLIIEQPRDSYSSNNSSLVSSPITPTSRNSNPNSNFLKLKIYLNNSDKDIIKFKILKSDIKNLKNLKKIINLKLGKDIGSSSFKLKIIGLINDREIDDSNEIEFMKTLINIDKCKLALIGL